MKILFKIFFVVILLGVAFLSSTCHKTSYITWEGHVQDSLGRPIKGLIISLNGCNKQEGESKPNVCYEEYNIGSTKTDTSGHFSIVGKASPSGDYMPLIDNPYGPYWNPMETVDAAELKTTHYTDIHLQR